MDNLADLVGYAAAILGTICWIPQTVKAWRSKETKDLSLWANLMVFGTISLWLLYGLLIGSWPLIVGNVISLLAVGGIVVAVIHFAKTLD